MRTLRFVVSLIGLSLISVRTLAFAPPEAPTTSAEATAESAVADIVAAFEAVPVETKSLKFRLETKELPRGGHLQGIQMQSRPNENCHLAFLSHDSLTVAYLVIAEFPADLAGEGRALCAHTLPSDGKSPPLRHAGGIQLMGDVLVVGLEDNQQKIRSEVQFWDVSNPGKPALWPHLTVRRSGPEKEWTAGAVGLVARQRDHLLVVGNWDCRTLDFYVSNGKPLADPECRFQTLARWRSDAAEKPAWRPDQRFGAYQCVNLVADSHGDIYLVGFDTQPDGQNIAELFAVDVRQEANCMLRKVARKPLRLGAGNHFRNGGGLWVDGGRLAFLATPRNLQGETTLGIARPEH